MRTTEGARAAGPHPATGSGDLSELSLAHAVAHAHGATLADGLRIQREHVEALKDPTSVAALAVLARQLPLLEALFQRFAEDAVAERQGSRRAELLRGALQAQQAYARTFTLVRALAPQAPTLVEGVTVPTDNGSGSDLVGLPGAAGADGGSGAGAASGWPC